MKPFIIFFLVAIPFSLLTGCQTPEEQLQSSQQRKIDMLQKQMEQDMKRSEYERTMAQ
jgi:hypothetical protein